MLLSREQTVMARKIPFVSVGGYTMKLTTVIHINGCEAMPIPWPPLQTVIFACKHRSIDAYQEQISPWARNSELHMSAWKVSKQVWWNARDLHVHLKLRWTKPSDCRAAPFAIARSEQKGNRGGEERGGRGGWRKKEEEEGRCDLEALLQEKL